MKLTSFPSLEWYESIKESEKPKPIKMPTGTDEIQEELLDEVGSVYATAYNIMNSAMITLLVENPPADESN